MIQNMEGASQFQDTHLKKKEKQLDMQQTQRYVKMQKKFVKSVIQHSQMPQTQFQQNHIWDLMKLLNFQKSILNVKCNLLIILQINIFQMIINLKAAPTFKNVKIQTGRRRTATDAIKAQNIAKYKNAPAQRQISPCKCVCFIVFMAYQFSM